jgi:hypothetical protein
MGVAEARRMIEDLERCDAPMKMGQIRVLGGAFARVPVHATAFAHRQSRIMIAYLAMHEGEAEATAGYDRWATESIDALRQDDAGIYVNFLGEQGKAGLQSAYPAATLARLREVKRIYDPENVFRGNWNIAPAA